MKFDKTMDIEETTQHLYSTISDNKFFTNMFPRKEDGEQVIVVRVVPEKYYTLTRIASILPKSWNNFKVVVEKSKLAK